MTKSVIHVTVAAVSSAMALTLAVGEVRAANVVHWDWGAAIVESVAVSVDINADLSPIGLAMIEDLQVFIGDISAISEVGDPDPLDPGNPGDPDQLPPLDFGISNVVFYLFDGQDWKQIKVGYQGDIKDATQPQDLIASIETAVGGGYEVRAYTIKGGQIYTHVDVVDGDGIGDGGDLAQDLTDLGLTPTDQTGNSGGVELELSYNPANGELSDDSGVVAVVPYEIFQNMVAANQRPAANPGILDLEGTQVAIENLPGPSVILDALSELPEVISAATAVANNVNLDTDTAVQLHETQIVLGEGEIEEGVDASGFTVQLWALLPTLHISEILAVSSVDGVRNASVDSTATAVANNARISTVASTTGDNLFIGDVLQFAAANTTAISTVSDVWVVGYTNLGLIERPLAESVATAVGNSLSIVLAP